MKVVNAGYEFWEILHEDRKVGEIRTFSGFRSRTKSVYVNDKSIGDIKNQKEAIEKIEQFFSDNKKKIVEVEKLIEELKEDVENVKNEVSANALKREIEAQTE